MTGVNKKWIEGATQKSVRSIFTNPEYELLALHPEYFLPRGAVLDPATRTCKNYVPSRDRCLRESIEHDSARLPPFRHDFQSRGGFHDLNIFLVTLNAETKFRRYPKMIQQHPPTTALPDDVLALMRRVVELVNLLYRVPVPTKGSKGGRGKGSTDSNYSLEIVKTLWRQNWLDYVDEETRKAYGSALMSGHDIDHDPALFEDAFPINDRSNRRSIGLMESS
ncbi:hypothetical protein AX14_012221 [Amanita brunnescens Koide BX004]|nr:hypothetical protein AX14_012221 [Amanita brunnescens Koide BX004]